MIDFIDPPEFIALNQPDLESWLLQIARVEGVKIDTLSYTFVDPAQMLQINRDYLKHDYVTDIITFNYGRSGRISGEVYICADRVCEQAIEWNESTEREFLRVIVHGLLHLIGYNDLTAEEKEEMRRLEEKALILHAQKFET